MFLTISRSVSVFIFRFVCDQAIQTRVDRSSIGNQWKGIASQSSPSLFIIWETTFNSHFKLRILFIYYLSYYFRCALFFRLLIITDVSLDSGFNRIFHSLPIFVIYRILDEQNVFKIIITWAFNRSIMFLFKIQCNGWYHFSFLPYLITMEWQSYVLVTDNF